MAVGDFITTIESDDEQPLTTLKDTKCNKSQDAADLEDAQLNAEFTFDLAADPYADILGGHSLHDFVKKGSRPVSFRLRTAIQSTEFFLPGTNIRRRHHYTTKIIIAYEKAQAGR